MPDEKVREFPNLTGRKFSSTNQPTREERAMGQNVRKAMHDAFDILGGAAWLVTFARKSDENARTFVNALIRTAPQQLNLEGDATLTVRVMKLGGEELELTLKGEAPALPAPK